MCSRFHMLNKRRDVDARITLPSTRQGDENTQLPQPDRQDRIEGAYLVGAGQTRGTAQVLNDLVALLDEACGGRRNSETGHHLPSIEDRRAHALDALLELLPVECDTGSSDSIQFAAQFRPVGDRCIGKSPEHEALDRRFANFVRRESQRSLPLARAWMFSEYPAFSPTTRTACDPSTVASTRSHRGARRCDTRVSPVVSARRCSAFT